MEHLTKILEKIATSKGIVALIIAVALAFFVYKNFDFITEITFKIDRPKAVDKGQGTETGEGEKTLHYQLSIKVVDVTPSSFRIPSYLYIEIENAGPGRATMIEILVDLGKSQVEEADLKPADRCSFFTEAKGASIARIKCSELNGHESVYFYALTSVPIFQKVVVNSSGIPSPIEYSWFDYLSDKSSGRFLSPGVIFFIKFVLGGMVLALAVYLTIVMIVILNRFFKIT